VKKISVRSQFIASPGNVLIQWDFAKAESWIVAYLADDPNMKSSLLHGDLHADTAANALFHVDIKDVTKVMRYTGKRYNHASGYRMGFKKAMQVINSESDKPPYLVVSLQESKEFNLGWHGYYPRVKNVWWIEIEEKASKNRTMINTYGVVHVFFERWGEELFKQMTAWEPQSTVAYHANGMIHPELGVVGGFVEVDKQFVETGVFKIVNQSHDSIVSDVPRDRIDDVKEPVRLLLQRPLIINGEEFTIPVDVEIGEVWGELEAA